ncbi:MAG: DUF4827 domain-containing protein [Alloprevotella sp.]|nr:DUF4827 domain-containing protein [Alloprevotella sp.]
MRNLFTKYLFPIVAVIVLLSSCTKEISYAEMRKRERKQIEAFIQNGVTVYDEISGRNILHVPGPIKAISEIEFENNGQQTDIESNEYVLFAGSGVYMQIVRKGTGSKIENGQSATVLCRYTEFNIAADTIISMNNNLTNETRPEVLSIQNTLGLFTGSFVSGVMKTLYASPTVPSGWLFPFPYINIGRQDSEDAEIALVRLIVPSTEGQSDAYTNTYPCFYEISFERGR